MDSFLLLIFAPLLFGIFILIVQSLIDRSLKQFKNMEYDFKIKELESRLEKLEKLNKE
ncbi:hypothetical protein H1D32_22640 [Anaerobacillus sp. CMMVII]|uniref:hypothetical protein n=1 Tax=Anaerobacillus sp. CMMVII TaxID=2755588 RepID=UPI0021B77FA2|nr:hypothetical protein [Anaerobacillus sp. CMMVII]MCT8140249.1 hypothetical protein [Anaerobacillus sp. CMMVII]